MTLPRQNKDKVIFLIFCDAYFIFSMNCITKIKVKFRLAHNI
jgi:hypothetical protein